MTLSTILDNTLIKISFIAISIFLLYHLVKILISYMRPDEIKRTPTLVRRYSKIVVMNKYGNKGTNGMGRRSSSFGQ